MSFDLYESINGTQISTLNEQLDAKSDDIEQLSNQQVFLGTAIYAEACIAIGDTRHFFGKPLSYICQNIYVLDLKPQFLL